MPSQVNMLMVEAPHTATVTITINRVVVRISSLASVNVFRIASAKAMAPLRPERKSMCCKFMVILDFLKMLRIRDRT